MLSIAYVSAATDPMSDQDIAGILVQSRATNARHWLTGILLYHRGRFIQVLEGSEPDVRARYAVIAADPRHRSVQTISEKTIGERQFPDWTMGFRPMTDPSLTRLEGFDGFLDATGLARLERAENEAQQFLEWLTEYWFAA